MTPLDPAVATAGRALLDVNVLIALFDSDHVDHVRARSWLTANIAAGWASCAITQNGFVRILSQPRYPSAVATSTALAMLRSACATEHHAFLPCDLSIIGDAIDASRVHGPKQVTDVYLLALAVHHGARLVTFDATIPLSAVSGATTGHMVAL